MNRYFIDTDDGDFHHRDDEGFELEDAQAARRAAIDVLPHMARTKLPDGDRRTFVATVRDHHGGTLYTASLKFVGEWKIDPNKRF